MTPSLKPLDRQVIVITGATSGIGLATAELAAHRHAKVVVVGRSGDVLTVVVDSITAAGGSAVPVVADVGDAKAVARIAEVAIDKYGRIDTWVNNAGVSIFGWLEEVAEQDSRRLFDTNFWGVVNGSLTALPHLKRDGGALINVGSEVSEAIVPLQGMYSASKHAVKGFTDALRVELEAVNAPVSVTLIQPTAVDTPFPQRARNYMDQEPALPDPKIMPQQVAEAILDAATTSRRDVKVGMMARVNVAMSTLLPSLSDVMAKRMIDQQHYEEAPRHPEGTLYAPYGAGRQFGSGGVKKAKGSGR